MNVISKGHTKFFYGAFSLFLLGGIAFSSSCIDDTPVAFSSTEEPTCSGKRADENFVVECSDGSQITVPDNGVETPSCTVTETDEGALIQCPDGTTALIEHGEDGEDGSSCSTYAVDDGALLECSDGTVVLIRHGTDGVDGEDGEDAPKGAFTITEIIDPCGKESLYDEVLLRFANGDLLAHYSNKKKQHFARLQPGQYMTTDGTKCLFKVTDDGGVFW